MDKAQLIALLTETVEKMREDVSLMRVGKIKCQSHGADVTAEIAKRVETRLNNLETIIAAYGEEDA